MNKKLVIAIPIIVGVILAVFALSGEKRQVDNTIFHETLADPEQYKDGLFSDVFFAEKGAYSFRFVPNGDSPKTMEISLDGDNFEFSEEFVLQGTAHETGISEYYTWDYLGQKTITIPQSQEIKITINPNGNVMGPVSVYLEEN